MKADPPNLPGAVSNSEPGERPPRNPGVPFGTNWFQGVRIDPGEVDRRVAELERETMAGPGFRATGLLKAVRCLDLTTLSGDDTPSRVRALCAEARNPIPPHILRGVGGADRPVTTAAVCVYHEMLETALRSLEGSGVPVATVSAGFPHGLSPLSVREAEIEASVVAGASEIDTVIPRFLVLEGSWERLYEQVAAYRRACGGTRMKTILSTGELVSLENIYAASMVCLMAGADFIKTSTGKEKVNATLPAGMVMARAIRDYADRTGHQGGLKPAGGIGRSKDALAWLHLAKTELGDAWTDPRFFRIGASSLLSNLRADLEELAGKAQGTDRSRDHE